MLHRFAQLFRHAVEREKKRKKKRKKKKEEEEEEERHQCGFLIFPVCDLEVQDFISLNLFRTLL